MAHSSPEYMREYMREYRARKKAEQEESLKKFREAASLLPEPKPIEDFSLEWWQQEFLPAYQLSIKKLKEAIEGRDKQVE